MIDKHKEKETEADTRLEMACMALTNLEIELESTDIKLKDYRLIMEYIKCIRHDITELWKDWIKNKPKDKRIFRLDYSSVAFSDTLPKYFTFDELTDDQGFDDEDRDNIDRLKLNEGKVISDGDITVVRVR